MDRKRPLLLHHHLLPVTLLLLVVFLLVVVVVGVAQGSESSTSSSSGTTTTTTLAGKLFRRMVVEDHPPPPPPPTTTTTANTTTKISPSPSPIPVTGSVPVPVEDSNLPPGPAAKKPPHPPPLALDQDQDHPPPPSSSSSSNHLNPSASQNTTTTTTINKEEEKEKEKEKEEDSNSNSNSNQQGTTTTTTDNCEASSSSYKCMDQTMIACLQHPKQIILGIQKFTLLVQNEGESSLKVNIIVPASVKIDLKELQIPKHQAKKVGLCGRFIFLLFLCFIFAGSNVTWTVTCQGAWFWFCIWINVLVNAGESLKVVLNAGYGDCVLQAGAPIAQGNIFHQIPSYTTLLTPVYGAYFFFLISLIVGGIWACCKFGKRGRQQGSGIPYQELEMGMPGSSGSAINVETADGWDQSWDDDWDEDKAVISPGGGQHVGNVSANGLTARSSNKEGWGNDWDE